MAASYPGAVKTFTTKIDGAGNIIFAAHVNDLQDEVNAVEAGLINGLAHVVVPDATRTRDLGTAALLWRDLRLGRTLEANLGTITTDIKILNAIGTWNAVGVTFTALKLDITDTASATLSKFLDLQVGGASKAHIVKDGSVFFEGVMGLGVAADGAVARQRIAAGTLTTDVKVIDAAGTWNAAGVTFSALKFNITDTASAAASLLADLQVGAVSKFKVDKTGAVTVTGAITLPSDPTVALQAATKQYVDAQGRLLDKTHTQVAADNTVVETTLYTFNVLANTIGTNGVLRLKIFGQRSNNNVANNPTIRVKLGATTLITVALDANDTVGVLRGTWLEVLLSNAGATNSQKAIAVSQVGAATIANFSDWVEYGTAAEDTTADKTLVVTVQWATANANNRWRKESATLELLP